MKLGWNVLQQRIPLRSLTCSDRLRLVRREVIQHCIMTVASSHPPPALSLRRSFLWLGGLVLVVTLARLLVLQASPLQLGPDEAQYWGWGQTLAWGYFSKPPAVGWVGGLAPLLGGDSAFGARWPSAVFHAIGTAGIWAFTARLAAGQSWQAQAAMLAGVLYLLAPGISLSSLLLSTDAIMIPLAVWALYCVQRLREAPAAIGWGVAAGALFGLSALGKYAGLYVPAGLLVGALLDAPLRRALFGWGGLALVAALLVVMAPNLAWNAASDGATIRHTVGNASLDNTRWSLEEPLSWLGEQFGVFGLVAWPVGLVACLVSLVKPGHPMRAYAATGLIPVLVVLAVAFASRANANWAAAAFVVLCPAAALALAGPLTAAAGGAGRWISGLAKLAVSFALAVQVALGALVAGVFINPALADRVGLTAAIADVRGWPQTVEALEAEARARGTVGIVVDSRNLYHGLQFSGRDRLRTPDDVRRLNPDSRLLLRTWRGWDGALNHAESVGGLQPGTPGVWLMASERSGWEAFFRQDFDRIEPAGEVVIDLGPKRQRRLKLWLVEGVRPVTRTREELARGP